MKKSALIIFATLSLVSCTVTKPTTTDNNLPKSTTQPSSSTKEFYTKINTEPGFKQVKINSKIDVDNGSFIPTLNATIYVENQKKIWLNLSAFFVNIARGIATPDGVKAYESYKKTHIDSDFSYLNNLLKVNFINYNSLQNLLLGQTFIPINQDDFLLTENAQGFTLKSEKNQKIEVDGKINEYQITSNYTSEFDLTKVILENINTKEVLEINYTNWINIEQNKFPQNVKIIIKGQKTDQIMIENTKFDFSTMETPYSVPNNYKKTAIK